MAQGKFNFTSDDLRKLEDIIVKMKVNERMFSTSPLIAVDGVERARDEDLSVVRWTQNRGPMNSTYVGRGEGEEVVLNQEMISFAVSGLSYFGLSSRVKAEKIEAKEVVIANPRRTIKF